MGRVAAFLGILASVVTIVTFVVGVQNMSDLVMAWFSPVKASFDCAAERSYVEQTICGSSILAAKDSIMANLYEDLEKKAGARNWQRIQQSQRLFVRNRDACHEPNIRTCLIALYDARISELRAESAQ